MKRIHFKKIHSTHLYAKENLPSFKDHSEIIITAEYQTGGIGRRMDKWLSPPNCSLLATYIYPAPPLPLCLYLSKLAALSLKKTLEPLNLPITFKEPNDLLINKKKISGILSEICSDKMLTSIGLNISQTEDDLQSINQPATSLLLETGKTLSSELLLEQFLKNFLFDLAILKKSFQ